MRTLIFASIILLLVSLNTPLVRAWSCCDAWGWVGYQAFIQAGEQIIASITAASSRVSSFIETTLYHSVETGFGKLYRELTKQSAQQRIFAQGALALRAQLDLQQRAHEAAQRAVLPTQQALTVSNAMLFAEQESVTQQQIARHTADFGQSFYSIFPAASLQSTEKTLPNSRYSRLSNYQLAADIRAITAEISAKPKAQWSFIDSAAIVAQHRSYCSAGEKARARCDLLPSLALQDADLTLNTIFNPGLGEYKTLSEGEYSAALAFIRKVVHPLAETPLTTAQPHSVQAQTRALEELADQAALSAAAHSFYALLAQRTRRHQR